MILYDWMAIPQDSSALPDPLPINGRGPCQYWEIIRDNEDGKKVLRPGWADTWPANEIGWGRHLAETVQKHGARWNTQANQQDLASLSMPTLIDAVHISFSSLGKAYKKSRKPVVDQSLVKRRQRRNGRKAKVSPQDLAIVVMRLEC